MKNGAGNFMLDRRGFFVSAVGAVAGTKLAGPAIAVPIEQRAYYLLFYDASALDAQEVMSREFSALPENSAVELIPLKLCRGQSIDEAVKLYKVNDERS
jgi:hypothetical protein